MAIPHPFKTRRSTGSPTAGGNVHTLAQHMASPTAHPQYIQKGDEVGGANISDHELSSTAHRQYLLRRAELALTAADYEASKGIDTTYYDALHHVYLENAYPVVVTTAALHALLGSDAAVAGGPFNFLLRSSQLVHTISLMQSISATAARNSVPSLALIKEVYGTIEDFITEDRARLLFASMEHRHDDDYAPIDHTHSLYDVFVTVGGTKIYPARADHTHDDLYWRKDEQISADTDLSELARVGIYPTAVSNISDKDTVFDLNAKVEQGNYNYWISKNGLTYTDRVTGEVKELTKNFPSSFINAVRNSSYALASDPLHVKESAATAVASATLQVVSNQVNDDSPTVDENALTVGGCPQLCLLGRSVVQKLFTNANIKAFARSGTSDLVKKYKKLLHKTYIRNGYSHETARWISTVLATCFADTPITFFSAASDDSNPDIVELIADHANKAIDSVFAKYKNDPTDPSLPARLEIGYLSVDGEKTTRRPVRISRNMLLADVASLLGVEFADVAEFTDDEIVTALNGASAASVADTFCDYVLQGHYLPDYDQSNVVIHDLSSWILLGPMTGNGFSADGVLPSIKVCNAFEPYQRRYLPYINYYAIDDRYVGVLDFINPCDPNFYFVQTFSAGVYQYRLLKNVDPPAPYFVDVADATSETDVSKQVGKFSELSTCVTGDVNTDPASRILHGYIPVHQAGTFYEKTLDTEMVPGKEYYTFNGTVYEKFLGEAFVVGVKYFEKKDYDTTYVSDGQYFVMSSTRSTSNLDQFIPLIKGTHWNVGGPVGWDKDDHGKQLDVTGLGANDNQVYMRVAIVEHSTIYVKLTSAQIAAGPVAGKQYYVLPEGAKEYEEADVTGGFAADTNYYVQDVALEYLWSKKPVTAGTPYSVKAVYYSWGGATDWNVITDEVEYDEESCVDIPKNRVIYTNWTDVYTAATEPELLGTTPTPEMTGLLTRGLFFPTFDKSWISDKRYYRKIEISGREVFERYTLPPTLEGSPHDLGILYECIDTERALDIWCAIRELTTTGCLETVGAERIVYNFGEDGNLVTWDDWVEVITAEDELYESIKGLGAEEFKKLRDLIAEGATLEEVWEAVHTHDNLDTIKLLNANWTTVSGVRTAEYLKFGGKRVAFSSETHTHPVFNRRIKSGAAGEAWTGETGDSLSVTMTALKATLPTAAYGKLRAEFVLTVTIDGKSTTEYNPVVDVGGSLIPLGISYDHVSESIRVRNLSNLCFSAGDTVVKLADMDGSVSATLDVNITTI